MRILCISHLWPYEDRPNYGIFAARQLQAIAQQGVDITLITPTVRKLKLLQKLRPRIWDHAEPPVDVPGVSIYPIKFFCVPIGNYHRWSGYSLFRATRQLAHQLHRETPFSVIYSICLFPDGDAASRLGKDLGIPAACRATGSDINVVSKRNTTMQRHFRRVCQRLDGALAAGKQLTDQLQPHFQNKVACITGTVNLNQFCPDPNGKAVTRKSLSIGVDRTTALFVGNLKRDKGVYDLIDAFAQHIKHKSNSILYICGEGPESQGLHDQIQQLQLTEHVRLVGTVPSDQVHRWMKAADVLILPSYHEGMPNVVMEAMCCGTPVIATQVGGLPAELGQSQGAVLVPVKDVPAITQAIDNILSNPHKHAQMSAAAAHQGQERFGARANATKIIAHLTHLCETAASQPYNQSAGNNPLEHHNGTRPTP